MSNSDILCASSELIALELSVYVMCLSVSLISQITLVQLLVILLAMW